MGFYGAGERSLSDKLRKFSTELKMESRRQKCLSLKLAKVIYIILTLGSFDLGGKSYLYRSIWVFPKIMVPRNHLF